jgi:hypothetical protein
MVKSPEMEVSEGGASAKLDDDSTRDANARAQSQGADSRKIAPVSAAWWGRLMGAKARNQQ